MKLDLVRLWQAEPTSAEEQFPLATNSIDLADEDLAEVFGAREGSQHGESSASRCYYYRHHYYCSHCYYYHHHYRCRYY